MNPFHRLTPAARRGPRAVLILTAALLLAAAPACERRPPGAAGTGGPAVGSAPAATLPAGLFLGEPPKEALGVKDAKAAAKPGERVVLSGWIGGSKRPFVEGRALFTLIDESLKDCSQAGPMPDCETPWDVCCDPRDVVGQHAATVQVVDAAGKPLHAALESAGGLKPLSKVVVVGTAAQAAGGVLVVNAQGIYVQP